MLNLRTEFGKHYRVILDPKCDGKSPDFFIIPTEAGYIAPWCDGDDFALVTFGKDQNYKILRGLGNVVRRRNYVSVIVFPLFRFSQVATIVGAERV